MPICYCPPDRLGTCATCRSAAKAAPAEAEEEFDASRCTCNAVSKPPCGYCEPPAKPSRPLPPAAHKKRFYRTKGALISYAPNPDGPWTPFAPDDHFEKVGRPFLELHALVEKVLSDLKEQTGIYDIRRVENR